MTTHESGRYHRTGRARPYIAAAFLIQRIGDAVAIYTMSRLLEPDALITWTAIAGMLCTTALGIAVWRRLRWARYVLNSLSTIYVFVMSFAGLRHWQEYTASVDARALPLVSAACYLGAMSIIIRSRRVRHFANK